MNYRRFGKTGLQVSQLVFGGGFVGGLLIHQDDDTKRRAIRRTLDAGINWIDTAPSYGKGQSEEALGWLLGEIDDKPYLSTKFALDTSRLGDIPGQIEQSLEQSLKRLQRDSVDLLQLHNRIEPQVSDIAVTPEHILGAGGIADTLDRLRAQGLFNYIGITALGNAGSCRQIVASDRFDTAQVYYNLLNPSAGQSMPATWSGHDFSSIIDDCKQHDVGVLNIRVFAAGVIATDVRHGREIPSTRDSAVETEEQRVRAVFKLLDSEYGDRAQTAIRFSLANPNISCVVIGLAEIDHLETALAAEQMGPLPATAVAQLRELYGRNFG
jgi:L-galactose dehydrogenase/L-glyceraldehyde 3-phosphate reductase